MSTPASFSGAAYSRTASVVSARERVVALDQRHEPRARDRDELGARVERVHELARSGPRRRSPAVASSPIRRLRVACTAACASGVITPTTGTSSSSCSCGSAAEVAALQATSDELHVLRGEVAGDLAREARGSPRAAAARTAAGRGRRGRRSPRAASSPGTRAGRSGRPRPSRTRRSAWGPRGDSRGCGSSTLSCLGSAGRAHRLSPRSSRSARPAARPRATQELTLRMDDGVDLAATLYEPSDGAAAGRLPGDRALPRARRQARRTWTAIAAALRRRRSRCSTFDARGHGQSGGLVSIDGPREIADTRDGLRPARRAARDRQDADRRLGHLARRRRGAALARRGRAVGGRRDRSRPGPTSTARSPRRTWPSRARSSSS